ncbi:GGDEF domain-containing protein [Desulfopila sp. IMCC35008]|uniref:GGDEF domain-containing protein n=1 Tax=Desulfopila sp. IMCC35008 TaxID=2653858 RepID=UPI0035153FA4
MCRLRLLANRCHSDTESAGEICSIGVASRHDQAPGNPDRLLIMADKALYRAKENGRNKVEIY